MSEITKIHPAHILRLYAWDVLKHNTAMTEINGFVPIIALDDEPQIADAQQTYLIYGFAENSNPDIYELDRGVISFRIKARKFSELGQIINALSRAFERCDISASQINQWKTKQTTDFSSIHFTMTEVIYLETDPELTEGGPNGGIVNVSFECVINDNTFTLPPDAIGNLWNPV